MLPETLTPPTTVGSERQASKELDGAPVERPEPGKVSTGGAYFALGIAALLIVHVTLVLAAWAVVPVVIPGWRSVVISSGSMQPSIRPGDVVVTAPSDGQGLSPGAVVMISDPTAGLVTHRIVSVNPDGSYSTMGDANGQADSTPALPENVVAVGRLVIPYIGLPLTWYWNGAWGKLALWGLGIVLSLWAARLAYPPVRRPERTDDGSG